MTQTVSAAEDTKAVPAAEAGPAPGTERGHVFYPWAAQGVIKPMMVASAEGRRIASDVGPSRAANAPASQK